MAVECRSYKTENEQYTAWDKIQQTSHVESFVEIAADLLVFIGF